MITIHPNVRLETAIQFAQSRGQVLVTNGQRFAIMPRGERRPGWKLVRAGVKRIPG